MSGSRSIYLGVQGSVIAVDRATGRKLWAAKLKGSDFVNVVLDDKNLYAATRGEIFCLDPGTGKIRWHNPLKGYGWGLLSIAGEGIGENLSALAGEKSRQEEEETSGSA